MDSLERLQGLHADLVAFTEQRLPNIERLLREVQDSIEDFKNLLDKRNVPPEDATAYRSGEITVSNQRYSVSEDFRSLCVAVGTALNIEEESAGQLIIRTQISGLELGEDEIILRVVQSYHDQRDLLLQSLRIILEQSQDTEVDESVRIRLLEAVALIVDIPSGIVGTASPYVRKCLNTLTSLESRLEQLAEQIASQPYLSQARGRAFYTTLEFQRASTLKQHEALAVVLTWLFRGNYAISEDLRKLHEVSRRWQRPDHTCIHYFPAFAAAFKAFTTPEMNQVLGDAQSLDALLTSNTSETTGASYRPMMAMLEIWWTTNLSGLLRDSTAPGPTASKRDSIVTKALDDGALEFMLSICVNTKHDMRRQPARQELVDMLLDGTDVALEGTDLTSSFFQTILMESYEFFIEAFISNMPDCIRRLKNDEDDRRLAQLTTPLDGSVHHSPRDHGARLHLESFLVLIAFSVEDRPEAAQQFWENPQSNLYGFLQWASRRLTVPRVGAFCETLRALANSEENLESAHKFLLEDTVPVAGLKGRKLPSMNYQQIFSELDFYARRVHDKQPDASLVKLHPASRPDLNESESPIMLASYLRLLEHLSRQGAVVRDYVLGIAVFDLPRTLLHLSSGTIPSYLKATIYDFLASLATDVSATTRSRLWSTLDFWASTHHDRASGSVNPSQDPVATLTALQNTLIAIGSSHAQYDAFVRLLTGLCLPLSNAEHDTLPFPVDLGGNYRTPGIAPYVDMVLNPFKSTQIRDWIDESAIQGLSRCIQCLDFMILNLESFDESVARRAAQVTPVEGASLPYESAYVQRHPFTRVMQWIFSIDLSKTLLELLHQSPQPRGSVEADELALLNLERVVDVLNDVIRTQATYFDLVKPISRQIQGLKSIQSNGTKAIEDGIITYPAIVLDLCQHTTANNVPLALKTLTLLQKLSVSAHLCHHVSELSAQDHRVQPMVDMLGPVGELDIRHVSQELTRYFDFDERDIESGPSSENYRRRDGILDFLNDCLVAQSGLLNLAHLLVGFQRAGAKLAISPDIENGSSMLDGLIAFTFEFPVQLGNNMLLWLIHPSTAAITALQNMWSSSVSSELVMTQLRRSDYLVQQFSTVDVVSQAQLFEGQAVLQPGFWFTESAETMTEFLLFRAALYDYTSREVRYAAKNNILALQEQYKATIQGQSMSSDGSVLDHATIFDLFDFTNLETPDMSTALGLPGLDIWTSLDLEKFVTSNEAGLYVYDIDEARRIMFDHEEELRQRHLSGKQVDDNALRDLNERMVGEEDVILQVLAARNCYNETERARLAALSAYVDMVISVVESLPLSGIPKMQFLLRMLQLILPKLDSFMSDRAAEAMELTRLANKLLHSLTQDSTRGSSPRSRIDDTVAEKLFQLFRICVEGVPNNADHPALRSMLYSVCSQYLSTILTSASLVTPSAVTNSTPKSQNPTLKARQNAMSTLRSTSGLLPIVAEDAEDGIDSAQLNALRFLAQLVALARSESSNMVIEALVKQNFLEILLEPLKTIASDFAGLDPINRNSLLITHTARMNLLLNISLSKVGASALLDTNLLNTLRDSMLFAADPDLGIELEALSSANGPSTLRPLTRGSAGPSKSTTAVKSALTTYFTLLALALRLLLSTFISIGVQNEKAIYLIRNFLSDYRGNMVGIFKRHAGISLDLDFDLDRGSVAPVSLELTRLIEDCVRAYTGLVVTSGFVEYEDQNGLGGNGIVSAAAKEAVASRRAGFT